MNYYNEIKNELINNEINRKIKSHSINKSDLNTYYNVGKILSEAGKHYGEGIIKEYSERLTLEVGQGYGISNLKRMRQFYYMIEKGVAVPHQLSWSHVLAILPIENTKNKLISNKEISIMDFVKSPILIKNSCNYENLSEKVLQKLILEDIEMFMKELGNSFSFIGSKYKIRIGTILII
ncbi:MAG: DUF1016 family protein [Bacilli bacterium]|nr:DUF1016 family protein [Bacilli bacterium]